ncbi:MAG TPA: cation-transporting P-type ATPase [Gammaproteobacteria bacterium]|mgnify:CR=1 FL=1|nr:cation-transporting P-type ATPase [Gammaproteobacteria bacterium]
MNRDSDTATVTRQAQQAWHVLDIDAVLSIVKSDGKGLDTTEAIKRLQHYGANHLPQVKPPGPLKRFAGQFHNVLIYVLLGAGAITFLLGHWIDSSVIFGVVVANAIIGFVQEGKAEDALRAIRAMLSPQAMALRDGHRISIATQDLVPGDIVVLQSGDKVPADLRLIRDRGLRIQEAVLTGESIAVEKNCNPVNEQDALADRLCMAYSGTLVSSGQGEGVVIATGAHTEIGRISELVAQVDQLTTPLLRQIAEFGRLLTIAILTVAVALFLFGVFVRDYTVTDMFLAAVGLAVAAIPEGLPAIMTITLAIGVQRMARRKAIIRRLPAVETLGAVSVICSDKTGTLTRNEMTVRNIACGSDVFELTGTGYDVHGDILLDDKEASPDNHPILLDTIRAAALCNDASLLLSDHQWQVHGDPMEGALLVAAHKANLDPEQEHKFYPRTDLIPFESEHRFMATLHHSHSGEASIFLKGAPERLLEICRQQRNSEGDVALDIDYWNQQVDQLAARGQRVLAIAYKSAPSHQVELEFSDVENGLVFLGLFGLIDPPRDEAITAVQQCQAAGIRVKMITGDHASTACAIARQLHLAHPDDALTGNQLQQMSDTELATRVQQVDVYARVSPEHKLKLVEALQSNGLIVAMTGDGVNDAPALKRADVGTAMGGMGTDAAREASEMVLADDNFASITYAVEEGRTVYDNLRKAILFILPTNGGEALVILAAILFGFQELPLTPVQILWVNMVTAITLALALAFEPGESGVMQRPPRNPKESLLGNMFLWRIAYVSLILLVGTFGLFLWEMQNGASIEHGRTVAVNTLVMFEIFYLFNARYILDPVLNRAGLFGNRYVLYAIVILLALQMAFTYLPAMQTLFGTTAIGLTVWLRVVLVASSVLFLVEIEKAVIRRRGTGISTNSD